ncbi:MAG: DUF177 domain-containing protein [Pseudomonadota bacterium]
MKPRDDGPKKDTDPAGPAGPVGDENSDIGWRYLIAADTLAEDGLSLDLEAPSSSSQSIAMRLSVPGVKSLRGRLQLSRFGAGIRVVGDVDAEVTRQCVASLEPMEERVRERFTVLFVPAEDVASYDEETELDVDALQQGSVDLAELLIQQVALGMEPYPRRADAEDLIAAYGQEAAPSPFSVLKGIVASPKDAKN